MSAHTPGRWHWWTSNSWKRLMSEQDGARRTVPVLQPVVAHDGHPDLMISEADMGVIGAAQEMWTVLDNLEETLDGQIYPKQKKEDFDAPDDREYVVIITAKQWRAIGAALTRAREKP